MVRNNQTEIANAVNEENEGDEVPDDVAKASGQEIFILVEYWAEKIDKDGDIVNHC